MANVHEMLGREVEARVELREQYMRLLSLLAGVCKGEIDPRRVVILAEGWELLPEDAPGIADEIREKAAAANGAHPATPARKRK